MAIKSSTKVEAAFSMASMADIVTLLLLFFVIMSTMATPNALRLLLPKSSSQAGVSVRTTVSIKQLSPTTFEYYVGAKLVQFPEIEKLVQQELLNKEDPVVSLFADKTVPIEEVVKVMNIASRNQFRLILATAPEK